MTISQPDKDVLLNSELDTETVQFVIALCDEPAPEISSSEEYERLQAAYGQVEKLVTPDDWKSDLGRYVTSLGAALIEWEERCEDPNG